MKFFSIGVMFWAVAFLAFAVMPTDVKASDCPGGVCAAKSSKTVVRQVAKRCRGRRCNCR